MANLGSLTLSTYKLGRIIGLPETVEIVGIFPSTHKDQVVLRLQSASPVELLTTATRPEEFIDDISEEAYSQVLTQHYVSLYQLLDTERQRVAEGAPHVEEVRE
jgi:hypothetical protein